MLENGFILLHRNILNWRWFKDANTFRVFIYLLLQANYEPRDFETMTIGRGQLVTSYPKISDILGISEAQARTAIKHLKATGEITVKQTPKFSVVTVNNYDLYQSLDNQNNRQITVKEQPSDSQMTAMEYNKQSNESNKVNTPPTPSKGENAHKKRTSKPKIDKTMFAEFVSMTDDEYTSLVAKLGEQGTNRCIEILDNYKGASGKKYSSDYRAILNWVISRYEEERNRGGNFNGNSGSKNTDTEDTEHSRYATEF